MPISTKHIQWGEGQAVAGKTNTGKTITVDPNDFYQQNMQFLTGQNTPSSTDIDNSVKPIFRLAIVLNSDPNSLAKVVHVQNATEKKEIDNIPSDYFNITNPHNLDNLSVFFLDFVFVWKKQTDGKEYLIPIWVTDLFKKPDLNATPSSHAMMMNARPMGPMGRGMAGRPNFNRQASNRPLVSMKKYELRPDPTNDPEEDLYSDHNQFATDFWEQLTESAFAYDKSIYSDIYTIWFHKRDFGYNLLEAIFKGTNFEKDQLSHFKDSLLHKKIIDLFELSDAVAKNDLISKRNNIFLLFTKWLNYKATTMSSSRETFDQKALDQQKTNSIDASFFNRLDDFIFYSVKCFFNILDQCLVDNVKNSLGQKGILFKDFFLSDWALSGSAVSASAGKKVTFIDDDEAAATHAVLKAQAKAKQKPKTKKTSKKKPTKKTTKKGKK